MRTINLESNFNNKIECIFFTLIKLKNGYYEEGNEYEIMLRGIPIKTAKIVSIKEMHMENISEFIAGLDMGCKIWEIKHFFETSHKGVNWKRQVLYLMLMETTCLLYTSDAADE